MQAQAYALQQSGQGDQPCVHLTAADGATAVVYLQGATVTSWVPAGGAERLFLSSSAHFRPGSAIRGGIPVCWPQFNTLGPLGRHGFARTSRWAYEGLSWDAQAVTGYFALNASEETLAQWPAPFALVLEVTLGGPMLRVAVRVVNSGAQPLQFTGALHSYLRVGALADASVEGLGGAQYIDKNADNVQQAQADALLRFRQPEDRVYAAAPDAALLREGARVLRVEKHGWPDVVVWNPGETGASIADLEEGGWLRFVCIEAAAVTEPVIVAPGGSWVGAQTLTVADETT